VIGLKSAVLNRTMISDRFKVCSVESDYDKIQFLSKFEISKVYTIRFQRYSD